MNYSIVIPAYNEESCLPVTLAVVRKAMASAPDAGEIIVVDNNSTDRTAEVARAGGARVVFEPVNQISRARNAGARAASGEWLVFLDADTLLPPALLAQALENLRGGKIAGGGAMMRFDEPCPPGAQRILNLWLWVSRTLRWAAGSFVYCTREGFGAVGGFSEKVYASEEVWFSRAYKRWARRRGLEFRIIPDLPVVTSARKLKWYSMTQIFGVVAMALLCPWAARSRRLCGFWYKRPQDKRVEQC